MIYKGLVLSALHSYTAHCTVPYPVQWTGQEEKIHAKLCLKEFWKKPLQAARNTLTKIGIIISEIDMLIQWSRCKGKIQISLAEYTDSDLFIADIRKCKERKGDRNDPRFNSEIICSVHLLLA